MAGYIKPSKPELKLRTKPAYLWSEVWVYIYAKYQDLTTTCGGDISICRPDQFWYWLRGKHYIRNRTYIDLDISDCEISRLHKKADKYETSDIVPLILELLSIEFPECNGVMHLYVEW